jgi:hypothetical protein
MKKPYLFKVAGIEFTTYRLVMTIFFTGLGIWGIKGFFYRKEALQEASFTKAKVTYLENSKGTRLSAYPIITYRFDIRGISYKGYQQGVDDYFPSIGDCIEIIYSRQDPKVSEINFKRGIVPCE